MKYPIEEIIKWAREGQAISPLVAIELIQENLAFRSCITQAIELITEELGQGPVMQEWIKTAQDLLDT